MLYDGIIGGMKDEYINVKRGGEKVGAFYSYRQHADEHERWLSALSRPDIHKALHHVPVVKNEKYKPRYWH